LRVLLATGRPSLGAALSLFLSERQVEVVGVVAHACDVFSCAETAHADVVVVDRRLGDAAIAQAVADLGAGARRTAVIVLGSSEDTASAHVLGADAFAVLGDPPDALLALMNEVAPTVV